MPSKSRRNRRQISQNRGAAISSAASGQVGLTSTSDHAASFYTSPNITAKAAETAISAQKYFLSDLKWIGVVAAIIIILLIASYFVFR